MDAKDLRSQTALSEHKDGSKYSHTGVTLQCNRNKSYQDIGSTPLGKTESAAIRPCAVIGPDRVVPPPPVSNDAFLKKGSIETWSCPDNIYTQLSDYSQRIANNPNQMRNISPRQTYQENMQRILVPPTYNSIKNNSDSPNFNHGERTSVLSKNTKPNNMASEAKYCEVPYAVNQLSNEHKNIRDPELCVPSVNSSLMRAIPHGWPPNSANVHGPRSYGAHDLYQYQQYQSCAGPRPPGLPMSRPHRPFQDEPGYVYPDSYYQDPSVRFKPYPQVKDRYPQPRFDYIGNYSNHFLPSSNFPPHKYEIPKPGPGTGPMHYPMYQHLKYLENRPADPTVEAYQRHPNQPPPGYNFSFRNQINHPSYQPGLTNAQSKVISYQVDSSGKPLVTNKMPYENNNKVFIDYENARNKPYTMNDTYLVNEINRAQPVKSHVMPPNYPTAGMHPVPTQQFFRKDIPIKSHEYLPHFRNFDPSVGGYTMIRHPSQFSPNTFAISPTDSNTSNDTTQTHATNQEDCGYVSQSSSASARSVESGMNRMTGDYYRRPEYRYGLVGNSLHTRHEVNKNKKQIDVRQFLQMWNEGDDDNGENNTSKEVIIQTGNNDMNNYSKQHESKQEQLYVLGLVNVPSEELSKYEHIQKVSKLPENIKGYNSIELLKQFEEAIESSNISSHKQSGSKEFHMPMRENRNTPKQVVGMLPRPLSPLDVEAKISQSVIHKEVGCNFEIKPCSPKMLNVEIPAPVQNILGERVIEKVSNPLSKIKSPISVQTDDNVSCRNIKRQDPGISYENSSCKVLSSPFSAHNLDNVKTDYSIQDLETNSGVCLASLPRLDNEIELHFPEVNQQFIDANKIDNNSPNENIDSSGIIQSRTSSPEIGRLKPDITDSQNTKKHIDATLQDNSEKDSPKLSKYRKIKNNLLEIPEINVNAVRTDSVIIKNPENYKKLEHKKHDYMQSPLKDTDLSPINLTSHMISKIDDNNFKELTFTQNLETNMAIDFSLNKPEVLSDTKSFETIDSSEKMDLISEEKGKREKEEPSLSLIDSFITPQNITEAEHTDTIIMNELNPQTVEENNEDLSLSSKSLGNEISSLTSPKGLSLENTDELNESGNSLVDDITSLTADNFGMKVKIEPETAKTSDSNTTLISKRSNDIDHERNTPPFIQQQVNIDILSTREELGFEHSLATDELSKSDVDKIDVVSNGEYAETDIGTIPSEDNRIPVLLNNFEQDLLRVDNNTNSSEVFITEDSVPSSSKDSSNFADSDKDRVIDESHQESMEASNEQHKIIYTNNYKNFRKGFHSPQILNLLLNVEGFIYMFDKHSNNNEDMAEINGKNEEVTEYEESIKDDAEHNEELQNCVRCPIVSEEKLPEEKMKNAVDDSFVTEEDAISNYMSSNTVMDCENKEKLETIIKDEFALKEENILAHSVDEEQYIGEKTDCSTASQNSETEIIESQKNETEMTESKNNETEITESQNNETKISQSHSSETEITESLSNNTEISESYNNETEITVSQNYEPEITESLNNENEISAFLNNETEISESHNNVSEFTESQKNYTQVNESNIEENCISVNLTTAAETIKDLTIGDGEKKNDFDKSSLENMQYENTNANQDDILTHTTTHVQGDLSNNKTDYIMDSITPTKCHSKFTVCNIQLECIGNADSDENIVLPVDSNQSVERTVKRTRSLKRSFSDSALNSYTQERIWSTKRRKTNRSNLEENIINENICSFIQNTRRNSISSINNEQNLSFCILIDDTCILTADSEQDKICFAEVTENNDVSETVENILIENVICPQDETVLTDSTTYECQENESMNEETWVEDIACVETVVCDEIVENIIISSPSSHKNDCVETDGSENIAQDVVISSDSYSHNDFIETEVNVDIAEDVVISSPPYSKSDYIASEISDDIAENIVFSSSPKGDFVETEVSEDIAEDIVISSISSLNGDSEREKCKNIDENEVFNILSSKCDSEICENIAEAMGLTSPSSESNYVESEIIKDNAENMGNSSLSPKEDFVESEDFINEDVPYDGNASMSLPSSHKDSHIGSEASEDVKKNALMSSVVFSKNDCSETLLSSVIKSDIDISYPSTPKNCMDCDFVRSMDTGSSPLIKQTFDKMEVSNVAEDMVSSPSSAECDPSEYDEYSSLCDNLYKHTNRIKSMYRERISDDHAQIVNTLFRTSQMDFNKTLKERDELLIDTLSNNEYFRDEPEPGYKGPQTPERCKPRIDTDNTVLLKPATIDENISSIPLPSPKVCSYNKIEHNVPELYIPQDNTVNSCESSIDNIFAYEDASYTSSSPEVSSTTSEERNSSILLKITNLNGARISQINEVKSERKPRCKFTENKDYCNSNIPNRPLITKAAQKYIPPIKESIRDLKVKISLPQQSLLKLKEMKLSKTTPKVINKQSNANIPKISKKPKPNFEDVLKSIDEIQIKMHKEKNRKPKTAVPKVVIKKNEYGSHYTSTPTKKAFNPDLTGRKWQPWVFLEKNSFIDKMALHNKTKAVFNHRKNTYVLAEHFKKYKSVATSTKFVISQPNSNKYTGQLKYTIRLKHSY